MNWNISIQTATAICKARLARCAAKSLVSASAKTDLEDRVATSAFPASSTIRTVSPATARRPEVHRKRATPTDDAHVCRTLLANNVRSAARDTTITPNAWRVTATRMEHPESRATTTDNVCARATLTAKLVTSAKRVSTTSLLARNATAIRLVSLPSSLVVVPCRLGNCANARVVWLVAFATSVSHCFGI